MATTGSSTRTSGIVIAVMGALMALVTLIWNDGDNRTVFIAVGVVFFAVGVATWTSARRKT